MAAPLLAQLVGGDFMFAFISAVSFATILAVVAGIVVTGATAFSHDFYNEILKDGKATQKQQMFMVRTFIHCHHSYFDCLIFISTGV